MRRSMKWENNRIVFPNQWNRCAIRVVHPLAPVPIRIRPHYLSPQIFDTWEHSKRIGANIRWETEFNAWKKCQSMCESMNVCPKYSDIYFGAIYGNLWQHKSTQFSVFIQYKHFLSSQTDCHKKYNNHLDIFSNRRHASGIIHSNKLPISRFFAVIWERVVWTAFQSTESALGDNNAFLYHNILSDSSDDNIIALLQNRKKTKKSHKIGSTQ